MELVVQATAQVAAFTGVLHLSYHPVPSARPWAPLRCISAVKPLSFAHLCVCPAQTSLPKLTLLSRLLLMVSGGFTALRVSYLGDILVWSFLPHAIVYHAPETCSLGVTVHPFWLLLFPVSTP